MCWSIRVYWTVLHNLLARFFSNLASKCSACASQRLCCCCYCCPIDDDGDDSSGNAGDGSRTSCCCLKHQLPDLSEDGAYYPPENRMDLRQQQMGRTQHDYVIVDDIDANYLQIEKRKIETEPFYRTVDRATAEEILTGREDGTCLVRPYKEEDISIKYIVSIYARKQFFHLFIRQIPGTELFAIGQEKREERLYQTPNDIIEFYRHNTLQCTNKECTLSLVLRPIVV
uniref:SH2 domain-containing protein n=1 Tax=Musca domestica TaxID=7370 RepID=A0A1I8MSL7_MUSDO